MPTLPERKKLIQRQKKKHRERERERERERIFPQIFLGLRHGAIDKG